MIRRVVIEVGIISIMCALVVAVGLHNTHETAGSPLVMTDTVRVMAGGQVYEMTTRLVPFMGSKLVIRHTEGQKPTLSGIVGRVDFEYQVDTGRAIATVRLAEREP